MLVFTRKPGESLVIGDDIRVTVLSVDRDQVRIGIQAPRDVSIHRSEVYEAIVAQNQAASQSALPPADLISRLKLKK
jgi:carbon storage regulator